jgi:NADPH:quinone reductase-like Zn-dependent oxidoreductase
MRAAVVSAFDEAPGLQEVPAPEPVGPHEALIEVMAVGLHPRVRSQADGSHYTSTDELPLVPGIDGVGRGVDGKLRYFVLPDTPRGALAEQTVVDLRRTIELADDCDPVQIAAGMNPAMSSWVALRRRVSFEAGQSVMVLAATGNAGQLAVQVAKLLGAGQVTAVGRDANRLAGLLPLGADRTVDLDDDPDTVAAHLGEAGADVDVVIDYLWGRPTADALRAIIPNRTDDAQELRWIQVGSVAGLESPIPSAALRAARLSIVGSGQGSVPTRSILEELPFIAKEITRGSFAINARAVPLSDLETAWAEAGTSRDRIVINPVSLRKERLTCLEYVTCSRYGIRHRRCHVPAAAAGRRADPALPAARSHPGSDRAGSRVAPGGGGAAQDRRSRGAAAGGAPGVAGHHGIPAVHRVAARHDRRP